MKTRWTPFLSVSCLVGLFLVMTLGFPAGVRGMVMAGQAAPDFQLTDTAGQVHELAAYRGKVVVLAFIGYG
jgi:hypothetical protein